MKISDFFKTEYVDQASYDNLRKIASLVDGQKNASRKILYTILEKNIKSKLKVSQLGAKVSEFSEYLHGSLDGVIINLAQDFTSTNNIPLLQKDGNFGTRFTPEASASRYILTYGSDQFFELFKKDDSPNLKFQVFEGHGIEPVHYIPTLPILLINGSEGVSSGFAQKILPRNPDQIKKYIKSKLQGRNPSIKINPWFQGFNGSVQEGENPGQWIIKGLVKKISVNKVQITEVPIGYNLKSYLKVLDDLEDRKIIQGYTDKSEDDNFLFDVTIPSKSLKLWTDEELLRKLKLIKLITENYTVIDENNKIKVFDSAQEILNEFIEIKLRYMKLRKNSLIAELSDKINFDNSRYLFIKAITDEKLKINKRKKDAIVIDLLILEGILQKDGSFDYLLRMPIYNLTKEEMQRLQNKIKEFKNELKILKAKTIHEMWTEEL